MSTETQIGPNFTVVSFENATENGEIVEKSGYHQPQNQPVHMARCGCKLTTSKGAYRDVTVDMDGQRIHYYHQSPVVIQKGNKYRLDSHGYRPKGEPGQRYSSTKERISGHLPSGYHVYQEDWTWYLSTPDGELEFTDGMVITAPVR